MMTMGMKKGVILSGPFSFKTSYQCSMAGRPPMPAPMYTPTLSAFSPVISKPESRKASRPAAMAYWMKRSIFFISFLSMDSLGSKPGTSPAIWTGKPSGSNLVMRLMPDLPATAPAQHSSTPLPRGLTMPNPVTTTLLISTNKKTDPFKEVGAFFNVRNPVRAAPGLYAFAGVKRKSHRSLSYWCPGCVWMFFATALKRRGKNPGRSISTQLRRSCVHCPPGPLPTSPPFPPPPRPPRPSCPLPPRPTDPPAHRPRGHGGLTLPGLLLYVIYGVLHRPYLLGVLVGYLYGELLLKGHDHLDGIEGVRSKVVNEGGLRGDLVLAHVELLHYYLPDLVLYRHLDTSCLMGYLI